MKKEIETELSNKNLQKLLIYQLEAHFNNIDFHFKKNSSILTIEGKINEDVFNSIMSRISSYLNNTVGFQNRICSKDTVHENETDRKSNVNRAIDLFDFHYRGIVGLKSREALYFRLLDELFPVI